MKKNPLKIFQFIQMVWCCVIYFTFCTHSNLQNSAYSLFAVSSSYDPLAINVIRDADEAMCKLEIKPYTDKEWDLITNVKMQEIGKGSDLEELKYFTGKIPRMVFIYTQIVKKLKDTNDYTVKKAITEFKKISSDYYRTRIINKLCIDEIDKRFLALHYLNKADTIPSKWINSGLLICDDGSWRSISPLVDDAIKEYIRDVSHSIVRILAADPECSWRALELFILHSFNKKGGGYVTLEDKNLCGTTTQSCSSHRLVLNANYIEMQKEPVNTDVIQKIKPGTFVGCYRKHPVIDAVIFTFAKELFFAQITTLSYAQHSTKEPDLRRRIPNTAFDKKSVEKYYKECTGVKTCRYIFITTSIVKTSENHLYSDHNVVLVDGNDIPVFGTLLWQSIREFY